jgi:benzil reductase ((S)-benzoin forming)
MSPRPAFALPNRLDDAVVVITGASRGLGASVAANLGRRGAALGLCARTRPDVPDGVDPERVLATAVDVADADQVETFASAVEDRFGPIDLWINNAGLLGPIAPARDADPADVREALLVNIAGVMAGSATFARRARTWPSGRRVLVNVSSGAATSVYPGWSTYGPTKAAVDHYSRHVAAEEPDLVVHAVAPGVVDTDMQAQIRASDEASFPAIERFHEIHASGSWNDPDWITDHLVGLLAGTWEPADVVVRVPDVPR